MPTKEVPRKETTTAKAMTTMTNSNSKQEEKERARDTRYVRDNFC
jgi:hypothetical protein